MTPQEKLDHGARGREPRGGEGAHAPAPPRARAGGRRGVPSARACHGQGHPQGNRASQRLQGRAGKLRVGAAVGVGEGTDERVAALVEAGVDVLVVDTAHGHAQGVLDRVRWVKTRYPERAGDRRQRRHRRRRPGARRSRRRRRQGRHRPGLDLHHAHRRRRRRAADHRDPECRRGAREDTACRSSPTAASATRATSRRRIAAGAHTVMLGSLVRRHRGVARARSSSTRAAPTRRIAAWARSARCSRARADRYFQDSDDERRQAGARRRRGPRRLQGQRGRR